MPGAPNDGPLVVGNEAAFGNDLVFAATTASGQQQLWISDGSVAGTRQLNTNSAFSNVNGALTTFADFTVVGSNLYFTAVLPGWGAQVWSTDGQPGDLTQWMSYQQNVAVGATIAYNGLFYFADSSTQFGEGVYSSNGVNTFFDGPLEVNDQPVILNGDLLFDGASTQYGSGLYLSDGNPADLTTAVTLPGTGFVPAQFFVSGNKAFFVYAPNQARELWVTNGTAGGTAAVTGFQPFNVTPFDGGAVFTGNGGPHQSQVWFSDGTAAGTFEVYINQTLDHTPSLEVQPSELAFNGKVYFTAAGGLYATDGTTAGTTEVTPIGTDTLGPDVLMVFNGRLLVFTPQGPLVSTDGTAAGTTALIGSNVSAGPAGIQALDGKLYVVESFSIAATDGTAAGTSTIFNHAGVNGISATSSLLFINDDNSTSAPGLYVYNPANLSSTLISTEGVQLLGPAAGTHQLFVGFDQTNGMQLWTSDGTSAGTQEINLTSDIVGHPVGAINPSGLTAAGGLVYFDSPVLNGLWVTDGTAAGTHQASDPAGNNVAGNIIASGNNVFFESGDGPTIYSYDATTGVTTTVGTTDQIFLTAAAGVAYFTVGNLGSVQLARSNPGGGETVLTANTNGATPNHLTPAGSNLYFVNDDGAHGLGLYVVNGASTSPTFLTTIPSTFSNWAFAAVGADLYFENNDATNGDELWVSDGTAAGTHRVTDTSINGSANASGFVVMGSKVYFSANDGIHGQELWSFNGSVGGAQLVADVNPGAASSNPANLTAVGSTLYFVATGADGRPGLWASTGVGATELTSATNGANPADLTAAGSQLFFFGSDQAHGSGLFVSGGGGASFLGAFFDVASFQAVGAELYFNAEGSEGWQLWKSDGTQAGTQQLTFAHIPAYDFDAHKKSDFLIENADGAVVVGEVSNGAAGYAAVSGLGPEWTFKGAGDFSGDGNEAFLIQNTAGAVAIGEVAGGQTAFSTVTGLGAEWTFVGAGDFLGAGRDQFLIENTSGAVVVAEVMSGQANFTAIADLGPEWSFRGAGDFLGDGKDDFLIENTAGTVVVGEVAGGQAVYTAVSGLGPEWKFVGVGDFLGDGVADFLIENTAGTVVIGEVVNGQAVYTPIVGLGPEWKFVGAGDYLAEGHDQFLVENTAGAVVVGDWTGGQIHFSQVAALGSEWVFH